MTSEAPFFQCRLCGLRYRSDKFIEHENQCPYEARNSKNSLKNIPKVVKSSAPSINTGINELRDTEKYFEKGRRMSESTEKKKKDPKSNEESDDSPFSQSNRTETETTYDEFTGEKTETKTTYGPGGKETIETSTKYKGPAGKGKDTKTLGEIKEIKDKTEESEMKQKEDSTPSSGTKTGNLSEKKTSKEQQERSHSNEEQMKQKSSKDKDEEGASDEKEKDKMAKTPYPSEEDLKTSKPKSEDTIGASNLPELDVQAQKAYEKHQKELVPCAHCERKFKPDRLSTHEGACINRPKGREYMVPEDSKKEDFTPET
ncbi:uncharacterized protein CDAR_411661 [Caerostris darwini]|uniref:C2HC/C3H-type domain-containing protein n=1 Tax=Caerostris darwini TaxID=1538125 RepID=A0AAV4MLW7_9ARAC|nr:uncharacterized protein CDAR_411661 [Caerostris darwini]